MILKYKYIILSFLFLLFSCKEKKNTSTDIKVEKKVFIPHKPIKKSIKKPIKKWVELKSLDSSFVYDLRYATIHNFVHKKMYPCAKCYLRPEVAKALVKIQQELKQKGWRIKLFDCYRPGSVQKKLWKIIPDPHYVANPKNGSMHNRGVAVDLTIVDKNGKELDMGTTFDYFGKKAYHAYSKLPDTVKKNRLFLKHIMQKYGLEPIKTEWWHYSYRKKTYPIENWVWKCP